MNAIQKKRMYEFYEKLGYSQREISTWGTVDLKGRKPSEKKTSKKTSKKK